MQRTYQYRGLVATVEVELLPAVIVADSVVASGGFLVKVGVRHPPSGRNCLWLSCLTQANGLLPLKQRP
jgi:hypothetical protein